MRYLYDNNREIVEHVIDRFSHIELSSTEKGGDLAFDLLDNRTDGGVNMICYFPEEKYFTIAFMFNNQYENKNTGGFTDKHQHDNDAWFNIQIGGDEKDAFADVMLDMVFIGAKFRMAITPKEFQRLIDAIMDRITRKFFKGMGD